MFFRRKFQNLKTTKRPRLYRMRRALLDWFLFAGQLLVIGGLLCGAWYFLVRSDTFTLKEMELSGPFDHTTRKAVERLAEAPYGKNLFTVNLSRLEKNIRRHPWVKRVEVRRVLPDKIRIHLEEYTPVALFDAGSLYLVSREGKIFKKLRPGEVGPSRPGGQTLAGGSFPVISGFDSERLKKFPSYYGAHVEEAFLFLNRFLLLPATQTFGVKEVHYDVTEGITVTTAKGRSEIYFGRGDYEEKLDRWRKFAAAEGEGDTPYKRIDLHVEGKIFARL
ncbi:MAG: FtsQ-type POTRA domain-containing protein [Deltaproteobacteria bacterium]|nr:FtsQ-type POTRA domain-containing protein [Deltaproteobacteria bacterium]